MKMRKITEKELDSVEPDKSGLRHCPQGEYGQKVLRNIKALPGLVFPDGCKFVGVIKFGNAARFGSRCVFGPRCHDCFTESMRRRKPFNGLELTRGSFTQRSLNSSGRRKKGWQHDIRNHW